MMVESNGIHIIADFFDCKSNLDDLDFIKSTMIKAAKKTGADIVGEVFHKFSPLGITGIVAISESHLSIHTWPENRKAMIDVFTCGECNSGAAIEFLYDVLKPENIRELHFVRGFEELFNITGY